MTRGLLLVISGPSGSGKGTVCSRISQKNSDIYYSISVTTRKPRVGEKDGDNYFFLSEEAFMNLKEEGALLEWACVYGNYYGTPSRKVEEKRNEGKDVILEIDTQGAIQVRRSIKDGVFIFLLPPSMGELWKRIKNRGTDSEETIKKRLRCAYTEIEEIKNYDYVVVNDDLEKAVDCIESIMKAEKCRVSRNKSVLEKVIKEGDVDDISLHR